MSTQKHEFDFINLLNRNSKAIIAVCSRFSDGNDFFFDELHQECLIAIWDELSRYGNSRFRQDSTESTWVHGICYHAAVHYICNPEHQELDAIRNMNEKITDGKGLDDWQLMDELKEQLSNHERIMLDYYLNGDTYGTMANVEGISEAGARKRMSRLFDKLRKIIQK